MLPPAVRARVSVEAGVAWGWHGIVGDAGRCVSLEHYGASADYKTIYREFGITAEAVFKAAKESVAAAGPDVRTDPPRPGGTMTDPTMSHPNRCAG